MAAFAGVRCSGCRNGLRSTTSSAKGTGEGVGAHRGLGLAGEAAQGGSTSMAGGGDEAALVERTAAGVLQALGLHGSTRGVPAEVILGSRRLGNHRR
jgi:hypothetical protein